MILRSASRLRCCRPPPSRAAVVVESMEMELVLHRTVIRMIIRKFARIIVDEARATVTRLTSDVEIGQYQGS